MKEFIKSILLDEFKETSGFDPEVFFKKSPLLRYLDLKTGAIFGNTKTRRSLANLYAIYALLYFYVDDYY